MLFTISLRSTTTFDVVRGPTIPGRTAVRLVLSSGILRQLATSTPYTGSLVKYVKDAKICTCRSVEAVIALDLLLQKLNATLRMDCVGIVSLC
jgi:hypothetical protein